VVAAAEELDKLVNITERGTTVVAEFRIDRAEPLRPLMDIAVRVGTEVNRRRREIPLSDGERAATETLTRLGTELGLDVVRDQLTAHGTLRDQQVVVRTNYEPAGFYTTQVEVHFPTPLGLGLRLLRRPQSLFGRLTAPSLGAPRALHPAFDRRFRIRAERKQRRRASEVLGGEVADALLALHERAKRLEVRDHGMQLSFEGYPTDPDHLREHVEVLTRAAERMHLRAGDRADSPHERPFGS
jgi:hypothetical protein